jgi:hypothetical protein
MLTFSCDMFGAKIFNCQCIGGDATNLVPEGTISTTTAFNNSNSFVIHLILILYLNIFLGISNYCSTIFDICQGVLGTNFKIRLGNL